MALRFQEPCVGVADFCREKVWDETTVKEHNKFQGQKLINFICMPSV